MPVSDYQEALNQCFRFIDHGQENREKRKQPEIMSWAQDFDLYIAPINRIRGKSLDKQERDFYRRNRDIVDLKTTYSEAEADLLAVWGVGTKNSRPG